MTSEELHCFEAVRKLLRNIPQEVLSTVFKTWKDSVRERTVVVSIQERKLSRKKGGLDKQRQKTDQGKSGGVAGVLQES